MKDLPQNNRSLSDLAAQYGSDKGPSKHRYTELYDMLFRPFRHADIRFLEMGLLIGGPEHGIDAGRDTVNSPSIQMWLDYFSKAQIIGLDISDFSAFAKGRFEFVQCDMGDRSALRRASQDIGGVDIIIDDASHASHHQQNAFLEFFPQLASGGLYIIEDLRWQPPTMEIKGITKSARLFSGFAAHREFSHKDAEVEAAFQALAPQISGCFVHQAHFTKTRRDQVAVIHKK